MKECWRNNEESIMKGQNKNDKTCQVVTWNHSGGTIVSASLTIVISEISYHSNSVTLIELKR